PSFFSSLPSRRSLGSGSLLHWRGLERGFSFLHVDREFDARAVVPGDEGRLVTLEGAFELLERERRDGLTALLLRREEVLVDLAPLGHLVGRRIARRRRGGRVRCRRDRHGLELLGSGRSRRRRRGRRGCTAGYRRLRSRRRSLRL